MHHFRFYLLGGFRVEVEGKPPLHFSTDKNRALLAYLAVEANRAHRREKLATLLWSHWQDEEAMRNMRQALYRLRLVFDAAQPDSSKQLFHITRQDVAINTAQIWSDVLILHQKLALSQNNDVVQLAEQPTQLEELAQAVALYTGEFLAGIELDDAPEFTEWLRSKREWLHAAVLHTLLLLAEAFLARDEFERSLEFARQLVNLEAWNEAAHRLIMRTLQRLGRRNEAIVHYQRCCEILKEELASEPDAETVALYNTISAAQQESPTVLRRAYHNLPLPLTRFVGKSSTLHDLQKLLANCRLLTLTGAGGSGKTRLAIELGQAVASGFSDGVCWVEMAELRNDRLLTKTIASALSISESTEQTILASLLDHLKVRQLLLILDNCEHLVLACARLVETLLQQCPQLKVLATSRESLSVVGEQLWPVALLPRPPLRNRLSAEELMTYESVQLLVNRIQTQQPGFQLGPENLRAISEICHRLDGIPLALELAAARSRSLSLPQIATLLHRRFDLLTQGSRVALPRQQTLRSLIEWSHDLLTWPERLLFRRLAVFAGGWNLAAAEAVCADQKETVSPIESVNAELQAQQLATIADEWVVDLLGRLVEKSLVVVRSEAEETRYAMLDIIHVFAQEQLQAAGEAERIRRLHAQYYRRIADGAAPSYFRKGEQAALQRLQSEHENFRSILQWTFDSHAPGDQLLGIQISGVLAYFWDARNHLSDAEQWLKRAWSLVTPQTPVDSVAALCSGLGTFHWRFSHNHEAHEWHQAALQHYQQVGDAQGVAIALHHLAVIAMSIDQWQTAIQQFQAAIRHAEAHDLSEIVAVAYTSLGTCYLEMERFDEALTSLEAGMRILQKHEMYRVLGYAAASLADLYLYRNQLEQAQLCQTQMEQSFQLTQDITLEMAAQFTQAQILQQQGQFESAYAVWTKLLAGGVVLETRTYATQVLEGFAQLLTKMGEAEDSYLLLSACEAYRLTHYLPRAPLYQRLFDQAIAQINATLSSDRCEAIRLRGEGYSLEDAFVYAQQRTQSMPKPRFVQRGALPIWEMPDPLMTKGEIGFQVPGHISEPET